MSKSMRPIQNLRRVSTNTKAMILGNGNTYLQQFRSQVDRFLEDARHLSDAAWTAVFATKDRIYQVLDSFMGPENKKAQSKHVGELRRAWKRASTSGRALVSDVRRTAQHVQVRRKT